MDITRHFVRVGDREVHYRRAGSGPPFVLFHVSPQTGAFVLPHLMPLADSYTLIALDAPGYGESDPLIQHAPMMADYADAVIETLDGLGIERAPLYGSHTGANIAVEVARRAPDRVTALVIDGLSLSTPEVAQDRTDHYAPQFTPSADGAHLAWAWQHTRDQLIFWPWYEAHKATRVHGGMKDARYLHDVVHAKMNATNYWLGYRAAFSHDSRDALYQLTTNAFFVTTGADEHTAIERSLPNLPTNINFVDTTEDNQLDAIRTVLSKVTAGEIVGPAKAPPPRQKLYRSYVSVGGGQRMVRRGGGDSGRPLVFLHGGMRTSALIEQQVKAMAVDRPVLAIDIAGNGDSDPLSEAGASLETFAQDIRAILDRCGITEFDLYGESIGATLALEVARQAGDSAGRLILDRPELPDATLREGLVAHAAPSIDARWDGTHFLTAWHMLRDAALFWPWYACTKDGVRDIEPEIEPVALQARLLAWLKGGLTYGDYVRAAYSTDAAPLFKETNNPALVVAIPGDILEHHAENAVSRMRNATLVKSEYQRAPISAMAAFLKR
jgi:pimeloyl-ACP methyl ester carboxylesterase